MMDIQLLAFLVVVYALCALGLFAQGMNSWWLLLLHWKHCLSRKGERPVPALEHAWPRLCVQLPIYNEGNVAVRLLEAVSRSTYPGPLEIQVLDDSTDEGDRRLIDAKAEEISRAGGNVQVLRRTHRQGFKAGALAEGMRYTQADHFAIFDADFVPGPDFLQRLVARLFDADDADAPIGFVQGRWGHLNPGQSLLTRAQAIGIDGHFGIEQSARAETGLFLNFNGTAGIWKRQAIDAAGGWSADTLTEDMDLSYRAQLAGFRGVYEVDACAPAELPSSLAAFRSQQHRWAKGSIQTARKLLPTLLSRRDLSWKIRLQALLHTTHYGIHPLMVLSSLLAPPILLMAPENFLASVWLWPWIAALFLAAAAPSALYLRARAVLPGEGGAHAASIPGLMALGVGMAVSNSIAVVTGLLTSGGEFRRTPKSGGAPLLLRHGFPWITVVEFLLGLWAVYGVWLHLERGKWLVGPFLALYAVGFLGVSTLGVLQWWRAHRG
jgi:cellulose synthase/poly-beta-1,6-N-acetylglucosamine synthase-like glycosyltransferase